MRSNAVRALGAVREDCTNSMAAVLVLAFSARMAFAAECALAKAQIEFDHARKTVGQGKTPSVSDLAHLLTMVHCNDGMHPTTRSALLLMERT